MKGNKLIDDHVQISINLVRLKRTGITFETAVDPDKIVAYKEGEKLELDEIINDHKVFTDMKKGLVASEAELETAFETTNNEKILQRIIDEGEIQFTQKYRDDMRERKMNKLINLIHQNAVDPKTGIPHPQTRIRSALEEAKFRINDFVKAEKQVNDAIQKIRPLIPISLEKVILEIIVPAHHAGALHGKLITAGKINQENWLEDGGLHVLIEIPAGLQNELMDMVNNITHGGSTIEVKQRMKQ